VGEAKTADLTDLMDYAATLACGKLATLLVRAQRTAIRLKWLRNKNEAEQKKKKQMAD
jgi:hypothetical protein